HAILGRLFEVTERFAEAAEAFGLASQAAPRDTRLHARRAAPLCSAGDWQNAAASYTSAIAIEADDADLLFGLGLCQFRLAQFEPAPQTLRSSVRIKPDAAAAQRVLGEACAQLGKQD